jgi:hypothetical protein
MKADTFARLVTLQTLLDAEVGYWLEQHPASMERYRESLVARVSDLVDAIDRLDEVAAARVYDALVDFLSELPEDDDGVVEAALRFRRAVDRLIDRAMDPADLADAATWAVVLDALLVVLAAVYPRAAAAREGEPRAWLRSRALARAARSAGERMGTARGGELRTLLRDDLDRLALAVEHRRLSAAALDELIREPQRLARRARPSRLGTVAASVLRQVMRGRGRPPRIP